MVVPHLGPEGGHTLAVQNFSAHINDYPAKAVASITIAEVSILSGRSADGTTLGCLLQFLPGASHVVLRCARRGRPMAGLGF